MKKEFLMELLNLLETYGSVIEFDAGLETDWSKIHNPKMKISNSRFEDIYIDGYVIDEMEILKELKKESKTDGLEK
jgi:hypothetical protein